MKIAVVLFVLASSLVASPALPEARRLLSVDGQSAWPAIGRLNITGLGYCTGTLIASDLVLTAAHCLVDKRTKMVVSPQRVNFLAGYRTGSYAAHGQAAAVSLIAGYGAQPDVRNDLALIWLQAPLPDGIAPLRLEPTVHPGDRLETLSYGFDRSQALSRQSGCRVLRRFKHLIFTTCEGVPGVSGAPLIRLTDDGPRIVAVASSVVSPRRDGEIRGNLIGVIVDDEALLANMQGAGNTARHSPAKDPGKTSAKQAVPGQN